MSKSFWKRKWKIFDNLYVSFCGKILRRWKRKNRIEKHSVEKCWVFEKRIFVGPRSSCRCSGNGLIGTADKTRWEWNQKHRNYEDTANISGINKNLLTRWAVILSCGFEITTTIFHENATLQYHIIKEKTRSCFQEY